MRPQTTCREDSRAGFSGTIRLVLCLLTVGLVPFALSAQGTFTNSGTLSATLNGTNLVFNYSMMTTQGWVTLLSADNLGTLATNPQPVNFASVPPSRQGQFVMPVDPTTPAKFLPASQ
jgi:hypothetical protein